MINVNGSVAVVCGSLILEGRGMLVIVKNTKGLSQKLLESREMIQGGMRVRSSHANVEQSSGVYIHCGVT